jgi:hypothetical protein
MTGELPLVMLVGAPRSGTTWLQSLLGAHERIATPQETDLFKVYLDPLVDSWNAQLHRITSEEHTRGRNGLPLILTEQEFDAAARSLLVAMLQAVARLKPQATVVVEKSPAHSTCVDTILRFAPEARFLHIVRDGRDVASSLHAASKSWGSSWAPTTVARAARVWHDYVTAAREARTAANAYLELRYEDLLGDNAPCALASAFEFTGVPCTVDEAAVRLEAHSFERLAAGGEVASAILTGGEAGDAIAARKEPEGFFRKGKIGAWRSEWGTDDKRSFHAVAGDLLIELGYEPDPSWVGDRTKLSLVTRARHRLANSSARSLRKIADRIENAP